jgi:hypothetical protein
MAELEPDEALLGRCSAAGARGGDPEMKNILVIDGALNCTFSVFQATDDEFALLFPEPGQDMEYSEDLIARPDREAVGAALSKVWQRPIRRRDADGIHGTLLYELQRYKTWYREKREDAVEPSSINAAQRRLFYGAE